MSLSPPDEKTGVRPAVLMIDDEHALLDVMREGLAGKFDVETAVSTEEASMSTSTCVASRSRGSTTIVPVNLVKRPRTSVKTA